MLNLVFLSLLFYGVLFLNFFLFLSSYFGFHGWVGRLGDFVTLGLNVDLTLEKRVAIPTKAHGLIQLLNSLIFLELVNLV